MQSRRDYPDRGYAKPGSGEVDEQGFDARMPQVLDGYLYRVCRPGRLRRGHIFREAHRLQDVIKARVKVMRAVELSSIGLVKRSIAADATFIGYEMMPQFALAQLEHCCSNRVPRIQAGSRTASKATTLNRCRERRNAGYSNVRCEI